MNLGAGLKINRLFVSLPSEGLLLLPSISEECRSDVEETVEGECGEV